MNKYTHKDQKEKSKKIRLYNIAIYPEECQSTERYIQLFKKVKEEKIRINTYSDKNTRIRTLYEHDGLIYGSLINYTQLNEEGWFNEETEEIEDVDINPNLNPNSKEWEYFFLPQAHRLAIFENAKTSPTQIASFFERALNEVTDKDKDESVKINIIATEDAIEKIFNAEQLTRLEINVSYTNNDNNDEWEAVIDKQMKQSEVSDVSTTASGTKKKPIKLKKQTFLGGMLKLSRENGYAKATAYFDGRRKKIDTKEHPLIEEVRYENEDSLLNRIKSRILALSHRHE